MVVYKNLTASVVYALALMGNEEATKSLKTSDFDKVKAMRKILQTKFQGIFSTEFQSHIYMMFNAVVSQWMYS